MREIPIAAGQARYAVHVGRGAVARLGPLLAGRPFVVVSSPPVWRRHGERVRAALGVAPAAVTLFRDAERHKTAGTVQRLHDAFLRAGLARDGRVVAVGGGVVGDVAGFAAATYMRGVDWVGVPTTLLSMVDSSVGGKVGVNHPAAKNLVGAFHQPRAVVEDTAFLDTLPARERQSGAYEILKCAILADPPLFASLRKGPPALRGWADGPLEDAVAAAVRIKGEVVAADEREGDRRRLLNLGHTFGHALEAVTAYARFTHGEAVGWGLVAAAALARRRGALSEGDFTAIAEAVDALGPRPPIRDLRAKAVLDALGRDKKVKDGRLVFVLPVGIGRAVIETVSADEAKAAYTEIVARDPARRGKRRSR
jgi:3-dehydroquinate synthase